MKCVDHICFVVQKAHREFQRNQPKPLPMVSMQVPLILGIPLSPSLAPATRPPSHDLHEGCWCTSGLCTGFHHHDEDLVFMAKTVILCFG